MDQYPTPLPSDITIAQVRRYLSGNTRTTAALAHAFVAATFDFVVQETLNPMGIEEGKLSEEDTTLAEVEETLMRLGGGDARRVGPLWKLFELAGHGAAEWKDTAADVHAAVLEREMLALPRSAELYYVKIAIDGIKDPLILNVMAQDVLGALSKVETSLPEVLRARDVPPQACRVIGVRRMVDDQRSLVHFMEGLAQTVNHGLSPKTDIEVRSGVLPPDSMTLVVGRYTIHAQRSSMVMQFFITGPDGARVWG